VTQEESEYTSATDDAQRIVQQEVQLIAELRRKSRSSADAGLRSLYSRMAELRAALCTELEAYLLEARPSTEITGQINDMFR
jgi:hypothetical protein